MSLLRKAFVPAIPFSEYREDNNFTSALESIAFELDQGLNSLGDLIALESIAHTTGKSMTAAESKMLAFSMEGIRADLGAIGKPIVIGQSEESREIALESLKEWGEKAWLAIKNILAKLVTAVKEFLARTQSNTKALKRKVDALVTHLQEKAGIITTVDFERGEYLMLENKSDHLTIAQVSKNFDQNLRQLRKYHSGVDAAYRDLWMSGSSIRGEHEYESNKAMGSVESKMIVPNLPAVCLGGWGVEAPDEVVQTDRQAVTVKFNDLAKDLSSTSAAASDIFISQGQMELGVLNTKELIEKLQGELEKNHQILRSNKGNADDKEFNRASLDGFRMCIRHSNNLMRLYNSHQQALNYFYNTVGRASLPKADVIE